MMFFNIDEVRNKTLVKMGIKYKVVKSDGSGIVAYCQTKLKAELVSKALLLTTRDEIDSLPLCRGNNAR